MELGRTKNNNMDCCQEGNKTNNLLTNTDQAPSNHRSKTSWYFCSAFDAIEIVLVPVVWEKRRGIRCLMCRKTN